MDEASRLWPGRPIACILSLGTGLAPVMDVGRSIRPLLQTLKSMSTDTENTAREFRQDMETRYPGKDVYFRFNVTRGLATVRLEEWKEMSKILVATQDYLNDVRAQVERCAAQIHKPSDLIQWSITAMPQMAPILSTVPFTRDVNFIGRQAILDQLAASLAPKGKHVRAALYGLGGIGKSQIAIEYSYRTKETMSVFWVHAASVARFQQAFAEIAAVARIPGFEDPDADILELVRRWLQDEKNGSWLIILDNADDPRLFATRSGKSDDQNAKTTFRSSMLDYIPQASHGKILVTSRYQTAADMLVGDFSRPIEVQPMNLKESFELLKLKIEVPDSLASAANMLIKALEFIPLAITHAAAYIRQKARMSIPKYLELFNKGRESQEYLLKADQILDHRRDSSIYSTVIATWELSFIQIQEQSPAAADLLSLMAQFNRQSIPASILRPLNETDITGEIEFDDAIDVLIGFSIVREIEVNLFEMHRLVQLATQSWLQSRGDLPRWQEKAAANVAAWFKYRDQDQDFLDCKTLEPHAEEILTYKSLESFSTPYTDVLLTSACMARKKGQFDLAHERFDRCLLARQRSAGGHLYSLEALEVKSQLAFLAHSQGDVKRAEKELNKIIATRNDINRLHPQNAADTILLCNGYIVQNELDIAGRLADDAAQEFAIILGPDHADMFRLRRLSIYVRMKTGESVTALRPLIEQEFERAKALFGEQHPETMYIFYFLAETYQDDFEAAEAAYLKIIEWGKQFFGPDHYNTQRAMGQLSLVYYTAERYDDAIDLGVKALNGLKKAIGTNQPDVIRGLMALSGVYHTQNRIEESIDTALEAAEIRRKVFGDDHHLTIANLDSLAATCKYHNAWRQRVIVLEHVVAIRSKTDGQKSDITILDTINLAVSYWKSGRELEADATFLKAAQLLDLERISLSKEKAVLPIPEDFKSSEDGVRMPDKSSEDNDQRPHQSSEIGHQILFSQTTKLEYDIAVKKRSNRDPDPVLAALSDHYAKAQNYSQAIILADLIVQKQARLLGEDNSHLVPSLNKLSSYEQEYSRQLKTVEKRLSGTTLAEDDNPGCDA